jgi:uncharacterized BrkB/YihY/UPF0761 family membrane protein
VTRDLGLLLVVSLATGLLISSLQGVLLRDLFAASYILAMGLAPCLFSLVLTGATAGLYRLMRRNSPPQFRLVLWGSWLLGNLLLLLDQHMARSLG